ncbi:MAG: hypothetical protein AB7N76_34945 [Planctomycetota bacterium]
MPFAPPPFAPQPDPADPTKPGFSRVPPPEAQPNFDPSNSPLSRGGLPDSATPIPADAALRGLVAPGEAGKPRVMMRVRREGWVAKRQGARRRFASVADHPTPRERVLDGLRARGGLLERSKRNAARPRFNLRGHL